jgi:hypothetical protein
MPIKFLHGRPLKPEEPGHLLFDLVEANDLWIRALVARRSRFSSTRKGAACVQWADGRGRIADLIVLKPSGVVSANHVLALSWPVMAGTVRAWG